MLLLKYKKCSTLMDTGFIYFLMVKKEEAHDLFSIEVICFLKVCNIEK